jgi:transcriptional regulator with XRE-family HTH domain
MKRKSIYDRKMEDPKFRETYEEVSANLAIGERIAELRHKSHITQAELAERVHTSRTAIARYESGKYDNYNIVTLKRIAKALGQKLEISFS